MRDTTERPEAVAARTVRLVGTDMQKIEQEVKSLLLNPEDYKRMANNQNPYGDGTASKKIIEFMVDRSYQ